jgi:hypothetical protein
MIGLSNNRSDPGRSLLTPMTSNSRYSPPLPRFVQSIKQPFLYALKAPGAFMKQWSHVLSAQYDYSTVEARMQFFAGPLVTPVLRVRASGGTIRPHEASACRLSATNLKNSATTNWKS